MGRGKHKSRNALPWVQPKTLLKGMVGRIVWVEFCVRNRVVGGTSTAKARQDPTGHGPTRAGN